MTSLWPRAAAKWRAVLYVSRHGKEVHRKRKKEREGQEYKRERKCEVNSSSPFLLVYCVDFVLFEVSGDLLDPDQVSLPSHPVQPG